MADDEWVRLLWHLDNSELYQALTVVGPRHMIQSERLDDVIEGYYRPEEEIGASGIKAGELFDEDRRAELLKYVHGLPAAQRLQVGSMNRKLAWTFPGHVVRDISVTRWAGRSPAGG